ncbi:MAG: thioesterase family protein [Acidimicrobiales bacterium]
MGDLAQDTAVEGDGGSYCASLSADWEIWGPNGGYLAALALRAAGAHSGLPRPATLACHFLQVAAFAEVTLEVTTLRRSRRAESVRVSMAQEGRPVLEALVWAVDDDLDGPVHDAAPPPTVPGPDGLASADELRPPGAPSFSFFTNLEGRPIDWVEGWDHRPAGEPRHQCWYRFRPRAAFGDPWVDAGRLAIVLDTFSWPAATRAHAGGTLAHIAPSLDLACRFHRMTEAATAEWLLVDSRSPVGAEGLVGGTASVWDAHGRLLASGGQQMLARPGPGS